MASSLRAHATAVHPGPAHHALPSHRTLSSILTPYEAHPGLSIAHRLSLIHGLLAHVVVSL